MKMPFKSMETIERYSLIDYGKRFGFIVNGDGNHDFTKYMSYEECIGQAIKLFINEVLENSIDNHFCKNYVPIDINSINKHMLERLNNHCIHLIINKQNNCIIKNN